MSVQDARLEVRVPRALLERLPSRGRSEFVRAALEAALGSSDKEAVGPASGVRKVRPAPSPAKPFVLPKIAPRRQF